MYRTSVDEARGVIKIYDQPVRRWKPILVLLVASLALTASGIGSFLYGPSSQSGRFFLLAGVGAILTITFLGAAIARLILGAQRVEIHREDRTVRSGSDRHDVDDLLAVLVCHDDSELNYSIESNAPRKSKYTPFHALLILREGHNGRLLRNLQVPAEEREKPYDSWSLDDFARKLRGVYLNKSSEDALPLQIGEMSALELGLPLIDISGSELTLRSIEELRTPLLQRIGGSIDLPPEQPSPEGCTVERDGRDTLLRFEAATIPWSLELGALSLVVGIPGLVGYLLGADHPAVIAGLGLGIALFVSSMILDKMGSRIDIRIAPEAVTFRQARRRFPELRTEELEQLRATREGGLELRTQSKGARFDIAAEGGYRWLRSEILRALARTRADGEGVYR